MGNQRTNNDLQNSNKVNEQLVVRKDIDVNEHDRLYNITYRLKLK
jgi:hypothetical protein